MFYQQLQKKKEEGCQRRIQKNMILTIAKTVCFTDTVNWALTRLDDSCFVFRITSHVLLFFRKRIFSRYIFIPYTIQYQQQYNGTFGLVEHSDYLSLKGLSSALSLLPSDMLSRSPRLHDSTAAPASLEDFRNFHGMLCRPFTARRCIQAFSDSTVLFMPHDYENSPSLEIYDSSRPAMNLMSYYGLVLISLTGLWTLLGRTKFLVGREENHKAFSTPLSAETNPDLVVQPKVLDYLRDRNPKSTEFALKRQFEYDFTGLLSVIMLHISCDQGKLHLVEVYKVHHAGVRAVLSPIVNSLGSFVQWYASWRSRRKEEKTD
eukprot:scaffold1404_cov166-Amphora_coffeaeformis.AAC.26